MILKLILNDRFDYYNCVCALVFHRQSLPHSNVGGAWPWQHIVPTSFERIFSGIFMTRVRCAMPNCVVLRLLLRKRIGWSKTRQPKEKKKTEDKRKGREYKLNRSQFHTFDVRNKIVRVRGERYAITMKWYCILFRMSMSMTAQNDDRCVTMCASPNLPKKRQRHETKRFCHHIIHNGVYFLCDFLPFRFIRMFVPSLTVTHIYTLVAVCLGDIISILLRHYR